MTDTAPRPLLFVDVDGTLLPFKGRPGQPGAAAAERCAGEPWMDVEYPALADLDPGDGARLLALGCEPVWATAWMDDANECIGPVVGLPPLPVVHWPDSDNEDEIYGVHWKTPTLVRWAAGRPFAWIDDEIAEMDRLWVAANHPGSALLHRVDPDLGMTEADFAAVAAWVRGVAG